MDILFGRNQLPVFISFVICGIIAGAFCDILKIKRRIFSDRFIFLFFDDLLFFAFCTVLILCNAYAFNDGNMKWYEIPFMIMGFVLYRKTVSVIFIGICFTVIDFTKKIICWAFSPIVKFGEALKEQLINMIEKLFLYVFLLQKQHSFSGYRLK